MHPRLEKQLMGPRFAAIEAELRSDGNLYHAIILRQKGNKIAIEKVCDSFDSLEEFPGVIEKDIPVTIIFTGKGILYRTVQADPDSAPDSLLKKVLPNVSLDDFFLSSANDGSSHFVSVVRKSTVLPVLEEIKRSCSVITFGIGAGCISVISSLPGEKKEWQCGGHQIRLSEKSIEAITYSEIEDHSGETEIGDDNIPARALIAFTGALGYMINAGNIIRNATLENERGEFLQRKLFSAVVRAALVLFFIALVVNFFAFSHYRSQAEKLQALPEAEINAMDKLNTLRAEVETRTSFLQNAGLLNNSSFAWYADQLAHGMPPGIQLTQMNFAPRLKLAEEDSIGFRTNALELSGSCEESIVLNRWLQSLKKEAWVNAASIRSYEQGRSESKGVFILDLQLN